MSTVRLKRLTADYTMLQEYVRLHPRVRLIQADGEPPERYQLEYRINSIRMVNEELKGVKSHLVEIALPRNYPRVPPQCRMLSPVFHPNIAPHAICVGDHWSSGESLVSIVTRIGELLAYQVYNVKSPLNGEAARWVELNEEKLPLDRVSLLPEEASSENAKVESLTTTKTAVSQATEEKVNAKTASGTQSVTTAEAIACPECKKRYRIREELLGKTIRCLNCGNEFTIPALQ